MQIRLENLTKNYGKTTAVNDLSVTIEDGHLVSLLGPSGCGKTTVLNMLSGIVPVTSGHIYFDGKDITQMPPEKRNVGLVFQNYSLYPHMTVLENICFPLEIKKIPKKQRIERAKVLADMVRISDLLERRPSELSGGQQQRVAIARALAKEPSILLLDEPLSNLDAKLRVEMREEILRIQRRSQVTTVFVTHDQEEASSISDEMVLLNHGVLQQQGSPRSTYDDPANYFVVDFLGSPPVNKITGQVRDGAFVTEDGALRLALTSLGRGLLRREISGSETFPAVLAIRAESILVPAAQAAISATSVAQATQATPSISAKVSNRYTIGRDELSVLEIGGQTVRAFVSAEYPLADGQDLQISLKKRGVFVFAVESGERLV